MTSREWLEAEKTKANSFSAENVHRAFSAGHGATMMLVFFDGIRSLMSHCLTEQGLDLSIYSGKR